MKLSKKEIKKIIEEHIDIWCVLRGKEETAQAGCEALLELAIDLFDIFDDQESTREGHMRELNIARKRLKENKFDDADLDKLLQTTEIQRIYNDE